MPAISRTCQARLRAPALAAMLPAVLFSTAASAQVPAGPGDRGLGMGTAAVDSQLQSEVDALGIALAEHIQWLSSHGSRVTGYPGATAAADYLHSQLQGYGATRVHRHRFPVAVPIDEGADLQIDGRRLTVFGMWPNAVRTSTLPDTGLTGPLVYGGRAAPGELDGLVIENSIVVLEYDCGANWVTVFNLGAAAVIFLEPEAAASEGSPSDAAARALHRAHRHESAGKFLDTPADLSRFYAAAATARQLRRRLQGGGESPWVRLRGRMSWRDTAPETLVAVFAATDAQPQGRALMIAGYYDAISAVPAVSPGADQASGIATWLEVARQVATCPRRQTVVMVATPGHFQALSGSRNLLAAMKAREGSSAEGRPALTDTLADALADLEIDLFIGLDLSSHSRQLALVQAGTPYRVRRIRPPLFDRLEGFARSYEARWRDDGGMILGGNLRPLRERRLVGQLPERVPTQGAVASLAGLPGMTLVTAGDERAAFDSPLDVATAVDIPSLTLQAHFARELLMGLVDDPPAQAAEPARDFFGRLHGTVVSWAPGSFQPDRPVPGALVRVRSLQKSTMGVRGDAIVLADSAGRFELRGIESGTLYLKPIELEAYSIDETTGAVAQAIDRGPYGAQLRPTEIPMDQLEEERTLIVFPCRGTALFDFFDPRILTTLNQLRILDADREAEPIRFGYALPATPEEVVRRASYNSGGAASEQVAVAFAPPGTALKMTMSADRLGLGRRLLLLNAHADALRGGSGEGVGRGARTLAGTALLVARDTWQLDDARLLDMERHGIASSPLRDLLDDAGEQTREAERQRQGRQHAAYLDHSRRAWALSAAAYDAVTALGNDALRGVLFILFLLLPFSVLAERLLLAATGTRGQVLGTLAVFLVAFAALRFSHPAFELTLYPAIVLVGFLSLAMSLVVVWLGMSRLSAQLRQSVSRRVAVHRTDTRRGGMVLRSLLVGVAQMRRRPWRTGLTCATLTLLVFSLVSFTSVRSSVRYNRVPLGKAASSPEEVSTHLPEAGATGTHALLVRRPDWKTLERVTANHLQTRFAGETVVERYWYSRQALLTGPDGGTIRIEAALGLSAEEPLLTAVEDALVAGRWFGPGEMDVCILPVGRAAELGIVPGDAGRVRVRYLGTSYRVVGLVAAGRFDEVADLHGGSMTPLDMETPQAREQHVGLSRRGAEQAFAHLGTSQIIVLPARVVSRWGEWSRLASVAVALGGSAERAETEIARFARVLGVNLFARIDGERFLINTVGVRTFAGDSGVWIPLLIASLIVFNTMLGTVYERLGEIGILSAVGLAPSHVAGLFMAEAGCLAVLSGVAGYLGAQGMARLGWVHSLFPGLTVNFSSYSAVVTIAIAMAAVMISTLYPARAAGRICLPGVERTWQLPPPDGDVLTLSMPFTLQVAEARRLVAFLVEYLEGFDEQSIGAGFYAEDVRLSAAGTGAEGAMWLAPFDQGVSQQVALELVPDDGERLRFYTIDIRISRSSGERAAWIRANRRFVDQLRKQFLVWRALSDDERALYTEPGEVAT